MRLEARKSGAVTDNSFIDTGGIVLGPIYLIRDPLLDLEAATKRYVDMKYSLISADHFTRGKIPVARMPAFTGDLKADEGTMDLRLSKTGIKAGNYNKVFVNEKGYVTSGGEIEQTDIPDNLDFNIIINRPTTVEGYGIDDIITTDGGGVVLGRLNLLKPGTVTDEAITLGNLKALPLDDAKIETGDIIRKTRQGDISGYLRCNGAWLKREDPAYKPLYNAIGGRFGEKTVEVKIGEIPDPNFVPETFLGNDFPDAPGTRLGGGKPWINQYGFNPNPWPDNVTWNYGGDFPGPRVWPQIIVTKNKVFVLGGADGSLSWESDITSTFSDQIYKADIRDDGTIGPFSYFGNMPLSMNRFQAVVTKNKVYILGGLTFNNNSLNTTYWCGIKADGDLDCQWQRGPNLSEYVCDSTAVVTKSKIYLVGGTKFIPGRYWTLGQCMGLNINEDGLATHISDGGRATYVVTHGQEYWMFAGRMTTVTKNRIYSFGGWAEGMATYYGFWASLDASGTISTQWTVLQPTENPLTGHANCVGEIGVVNNKFKIFGGRSNSNYGLENPSTTAVSDIDLSGKLSSGRHYPYIPFTTGQKSCTGFATKTRFYLLTGNINRNIPARLYWSSFSGVTNDYSEFYGGKVQKPAPLVPVYEYIPMFRIPEIDDSLYPGSISYIKL